MAMPRSVMVNMRFGSTVEIAESAGHWAMCPKPMVAGALHQ